MSSQKEMPRWASIIFLIMGAYIVAISLGVLPYGPPIRRGRAIFDDPLHWQITSIGVAFFGAGILVAFSKSKHWIATIFRVTTVAAFLTPMCWFVFFSGVLSTPMKILWAIPLTLGTVGAVLGLLQEAGLFRNPFQPNNTSTSPVDPIKQAETYLAYGRTAQALDVLNSAMRHTPSRAVEFQKKIDEFRQK
jgi:hypothetical protein